MIGRLTGVVLNCSPGEVLLDVSGVGYSVSIPLSTFYALSHAGSELATLHIHTHVREDAISLFGFHSVEERSMFRHLTAISGIGPKVALAVLSGIGIEDLRRAVLEKDRARLQRIPGVGRKTAERMLLELGDRLKRAGKVRPGALPGEAFREDGIAGGIRGDAVSALRNLGYAEEVAERAVDLVLRDRGEDAGLEEVLRTALGGLVK
jgi:Holliday junction DNA helicase RuvA